MTGLGQHHAVITGGGSGIGAAIATRLAADGARVSLLGRGLERLEAVAADLDQARAIAADVTDEAAVADAFKAARDAFGPVTILVNNAGAAPSAPFTRTTRAIWDQALAVNLTGVFLCSQAAVGDMLAAGGGRIINIASTAGLTGYAYVAAYCAAKHGVIGLTRSMAMEFANKGITVNAICPGYTDTDIVADAIANIVAKTGRSSDEARASLTRHNPQGRLIAPGEVAAMAAWLCSPEAAAVTGQALSLSGGEIM